MAEDKPTVPKAVFQIRNVGETSLVVPELVRPGDGYTRCMVLDKGESVDVELRDDQAESRIMIQRASHPVNESLNQ